MQMNIGLIDTITHLAAFKRDYFDMGFNLYEGGRYVGYIFNRGGKWRLEDDPDKTSPGWEDHAPRKRLLQDTPYASRQVHHVDFIPREHPGEFDVYVCKD